VRRESARRTEKLRTSHGSGHAVSSTRRGLFSGLSLRIVSNAGSIRGSSPARYDQTPKTRSSNSFIAPPPPPLLPPLLPLDEVFAAALNMGSCSSRRDTERRLLLLTPRDRTTRYRSRSHPSRAELHSAAIQVGTLYGDPWHLPVLPANDDHHRPPRDTDME
jgi:hypothetical protein